MIKKVLTKNQKRTDTVDKGTGGGRDIYTPSPNRGGS